MMKTTVKYPNFSGTDFIRLYCAIHFKNGLSPVIDHHELEKRLFQFYDLPEFRELFQDICPKRDYINPENSYLDLGIAFQIARLFGLLTPVSGIGKTRSMIFCNKNMMQEIISEIDEKFVDKMSELFQMMIVYNEEKKEQNISFSSTELSIEQGPKLVKKI